jgi:F0F1-type ATP synthase assembly protein I
MSKRQRILRQSSHWLYFSVIGFQFPVAIGIGFVWGWWMDTKLFGTWPWLTGIFTVFGIIAGFINLFKMAAEAERFEQREARLKALEEEAERSAAEAEAEADKDGTES